MRERMVYNDCMIQLLTRAWRYDNGHICATVDLFAGDRIFFYDEEWSLTRSIPGLCDTVWNHHGIQPPHTEPLFICACGNPMCTFADYFVRHVPEANAVELSDFTHMGREMHFPPMRMGHEEYALILLKLFREFQEFESVSLKVEDRDAKDGVSAPLLEKITQNERAGALCEMLRSAHPQDAQFSGDLRELLVKAQFSDLQRVARDFPWKLQDLQLCLYDASEVVRYKACFFLGASKLKEGADILFDKLADESFPVSFAACRALADLQIFQPLLLMDELYTRKRGQSAGCMKFKRLSYKLRENRWLPFHMMFEDGKDVYYPLLLRSIEKLPFEKEMKVEDSILSITENMRLPLSLRLQALSLLKRANIHRIFPVLLERFRDGGENQSFRKSLFDFLKEHPFIEILDAFRFVEKTDKDEEIKSLCRGFILGYRHQTIVTSPRKLRFFLLVFVIAALVFMSMLPINLSFGAYWLVVILLFLLAFYYAMLNIWS